MTSRRPSGVSEGLSDTRAWLSAGALYVALALAYAWPLLPLLNAALPNDTGDPGLNAWILWWNAKAVPLTAAWWDAPIFFPAHGALALSETLLNLAPVSTPLQWAGLSAVTTYNVLFLLSFPAAALSAHALARQLTGRHDAGLIAGLAFGFSPYRAAQMPHLQSLWSCWMPLGLFALHRFLAGRRPRFLVLFGICWLLNGLATGYFFFFFSTLVALWLLWFARSWRDWAGVGAAAVVATLPMVPLLLGYQRYQSAFGLSRGRDEIESYSADLSAIWATTSAVLARYWTIPPRPEGELYPGAMIILLTLIGAIVVWRRAGTGRMHRAQSAILIVGGAVALVAGVSSFYGGWVIHVAGVTISMTHPAKALFLALCSVLVAACWNARVIDAWRRRSPFLFYPVAAAVMLAFALGPIARLFGTPFWFRAPYYWLMQLPGGHAFRAPARFATLVSLCLSISAALAFTHLSRRRRPALVAVVALVVTLEGWVPHMGIGLVPISPDLRGLDREDVMLELPSVDAYSDTAAMLRATRTGHRLVNGFSGYTPPHYALLQEGLNNVDAGVVAALRQFGPFLVYVNAAGDADHKYQNLMATIPDARRLLDAPAGTLYRVSSTPAPDRGGRARLPVASTSVSGNQYLVSFDRPVEISSVELELGEHRDHRPAVIRISVAGAGGDQAVVWEGRSAGIAMVAALNNRLRFPLTFDLPASTTGTTLIVTAVDAPGFSWMVERVNVYGR